MGKSDLFTLYLNYGGNFTEVDGVIDYVGGQLLNKWGFDRDKFGYFDLVEEFQQLGYVKWDGFWYRIPKSQDFLPISDDKEVMDMLALIGGKCRIINVYIEGGKLFDEVVDEATLISSAGKGELHTDGEGKGKNEMSDGKGKGKQNMDDGEKIEGIMDDLENYDSDFDSDFNPNVDYGSDVSLDDLDFISDDEYSLAKKKLREDRGSVFVCLDNFEDIDQLHIGEPNISEYEDSDAPYQSSETDEEDSNVKHRNNRLYYDPKCDHSSMQVVLGMHFQDGLQCRDGLQTWAIENGRFIRFRKVSKVKCEAFCTQPCPWRIYASEVKATGKFLIKRYYGDHECPKAMSNKLLSSKWIAKKYLNVFRVRYNLSVSDLRDDILTRFNTYVPRDRLYKAKTIAQASVRGTVEAHYGSLRSYLAELRRVDPEGRFELLLGDDHVFKGLYIGFSALRKGFLASCRPFLGLDGCHLKTYMGGILMCAVGKDGNNQMFPVAWAAVEVENEQCWSWFLKLLIHEFGIGNGSGWILMSDQQKGLENAVGKLAPCAEHRNCARHIYANFKKKFKGQTLQNCFWRAVKSTHLGEYRYAIEALRVESTAAFQDFISRDTSRFCQAFISTVECCDMVENNISECFNGWITNARGKHMIQMLEDIRTSLMDRQVTKVKELNKMHDRICPRIRMKLEDKKKDSVHCHPVAALYGKFEVHVAGDSFCVDKENRTCSCRDWQLSGIPCVHAISAMNYVGEDPALYVHEYFTVKKVLEAYRYGLEPLNGEKMWPQVDGFTVKAPAIRSQPGRPKKKRIRGPEEKVPGKLSKHGVEMSCSICRQKGHNKTKCKNEPVEKPVEEKRKRGRPAKQKQPTNEATDKGKKPAEKGRKSKGNGIYINEPSGNGSLQQAHSHRGTAHFTRFRSSRSTGVSTSSAGEGFVSATQGSSSASQVIQKPTQSEEPK